MGPRTTTHLATNTILIPTILLGSLFGSSTITAAEGRQKRHSDKLTNLP
jgi:hypothetical protein